MLDKLGARLIIALRIVMGWLMLYAGFSKLLDPSWSAHGYGMSAKTFHGFYQWIVSPANIGWVNFINEWGMTLLGISLILGIGVRLSSTMGGILMIFYYLPGLDFPYVGNGYLVDQHIIYALVLFLFAAIRAGRYYGLEEWFEKTFLKKFPGFQKIWG